MQENHITRNLFSQIVKKCELFREKVYFAKYRANMCAWYIALLWRLKQNKVFAKFLSSPKILKPKWEFCMFSRKFMWHKPPPKASTPSSKLAYSLTCFSAVRRVLSPFLPTFVAALMFGLLAPLTANAAPVNVPLSTIADAPPQNGALSNGVNWSVELDPGPASDPRGWRDGTVHTSS
ncbi:MAG: hypothetical protein LBE15_04965, partial [Burkholderiales bacterium]|nr:hypothetical protein [Burkholderiales bacterium]